MNSADKKSTRRKTASRKAAVDPGISAVIGSKLKNLYDSVAQERVPDRFAALLEELARAEKQR